MKKRLILALVLVLAISGVASAWTSMQTIDPWQSGNARFECGQIGSYTYAYKVDAAAPNGSWTYEGNTITISGSNGYTFNWSALFGIGAVIVKGGTGANIFYYVPQATGDTGLYAPNNSGGTQPQVSHVTFCWNPSPPMGQWCSPGYWRQDHHLDSWTATGISPDALYNDYFATPVFPGVTLLQVLQSPNIYNKGGAFNNVGDLLSAAHPDVNFLGIRVPDSCPLN